MGDILGNIFGCNGDVPPGSISNSELAVMPLETVKGNATGGSTNPQDLTVAETLTLIGLSPIDSVVFRELLISGSAGDVLAILENTGGSGNLNTGVIYENSSQEFFCGISKDTSDRWIVFDNVGGGYRLVLDQVKKNFLFTDGAVETPNASTQVHISRSTDGAGPNLIIENSQANVAASLNETSEIRFGFGGDVDVARIVAGKEADYTDASNSDSFLAFYTDLNGASTEKLRLSSNGDLDVVTGIYKVANTQVVGNRITEWGVPTGTATRTTFSTATVTLAELSERVKALIDDLTTHGLVGA